MPASAGGTVLAWRRSLVERLTEGPISRSADPPRPLITRVVLPVATVGSERLATATLLALDPDRQGILSNTEPERSLVFWTTVLEAVRHAERDETRPLAEITTEAPLLLLEASDLQNLRTESLLLYLGPLVAGFMVYAFLVARGIAGAPRPTHVSTPGDPS